MTGKESAALLGHEVFIDTLQEQWLLGAAGALGRLHIS